ncbi:MAG: SEC-C metal-binding domain-containing protein, partial [Bacilli bacterium]|nr:SEC-C metal-binding domain-containing protein [Bacilli bacterium]MDD4644047.1 SEC-C metal-binding domain-containing protein [Bacilli bacterium]
ELVAVMDKMIIDAILKARITAQPQEEVKQVVVNGAGTKVNRNDPCPCGSGKKYKKCCYPKFG